MQVPGGCATRADGLRQAVAVKITDFGLSHRLPSGEEHAANMCVGTPFFMAPEVLALKHFYPASDVFSFGVTMWELMAGTAAFVKPCAPPSSQHPLTILLLFLATTSLGKGLLARFVDRSHT